MNWTNQLEDETRLASDAKDSDKRIRGPYKGKPHRKCNVRLFVLNTFHLGTSRTTDWRKRKWAETVEAPDTQLEKCFDDKDSMTKAESTLRIELSRIKNKKSAFAKLSSYQIQRLFAVQRYLALRLEGQKKLKASKDAAAARWTSDSKHAALCIRRWTNTYLKLGELPLHSQGKHAKRESVLDDQDVKDSCTSWLRSCDPKVRSADGLRTQIETEILPKILGVDGKTVSVVTVSKYMHLWGFARTRVGQQVRL